VLTIAIIHHHNHHHRPYNESRTTVVHLRELRTINPITNIT
jgi:hypothetical protein